MDNLRLKKAAETRKDVVDNAKKLGKSILFTGKNLLKNK